jgi:mRNA interferase RelE/StbE
MTYQILYSEDARKQIKKLDNHVSERIVSVIERCKINPYTHVTKVVGTDYFRARAGDWRILMKIENNQLFILVVKIGRRENIYD